MDLRCFCVRAIRGAVDEAKSEGGNIGMKRARVVVALVVAAMALAGGAIAATGSSQSNGGAAVAHRGIGPVNLKYGRAAAYVDQGGELLAAKGIVKVVRKDVGIFCVLLQDKSINAARTVPQLTVEWGNSSGFDLDVQWYQGAPDCKSNKHWIEVMTFTEPSAGVWDFDDIVAWNIVVP